MNCTTWTTDLVLSKRENAEKNLHVSRGYLIDWVLLLQLKIMLLNKDRKLTPYGTFKTNKQTNKVVIDRQCTKAISVG